MKVYHLMLCGLLQIFISACEKKELDDILPPLYPDYQFVEVLEDDNAYKDYNVIEEGIVDLGLSVKWSARNLQIDTSDHFTESTDNLGTPLFWSKEYYSGISISGNPDLDWATSYLGNGWSTPTEEQVSELQRKCKIIHCSHNNINGLVFAGPSKNAIFLPYKGESTSYWTGSISFHNSRAVTTLVLSDSYPYFFLGLSDMRVNPVLYIRPVYAGK